MFEQEEILIGQDFLTSLRYLQTLPIKINSDEHFENIIKALTRKLPFKPQQIILLFEVLTILFQKTSDEYQTCKINEVLNMLLIEYDEYLREQKQQMIILLSRLLYLINWMPDQVVPQILKTIYIILSKQPTLLILSLPSISSKIFSLLIEKNNSRIQKNSFEIINYVIKETLNQSHSKEILDQMKIKFNELILSFSQNVRHYLTHKLRSLYQTFCKSILEHEFVLNFFTVESYFATIKLYIRFSTNNRSDINNLKCLLAIKDEYTTIKIMNLISSDLNCVLQAIPQVINEIDSGKINETLKYLTFWINLLLKQEFDLQVEQIVEEMLLFLMYSQTSSLIQPEIWHQQIRSIESLDSDTYQSEQQFIRLNLEMMKSLNNDIGVWNTLQNVFIGVLQIRQFLQCILQELYFKSEKIRKYCISKQRQFIVPSKLIFEISSQIFLMNLLLQSYIESNCQQDISYMVVEYQEFIRSTQEFLMIDSGLQPLELTQLLIMKGIMLCYRINNDLDIFQITYLIDFLLQRASQSSRVLSYAALTHLQDFSKNFLKNEDLSQSLLLYSPSIIQRNIVLIQNLHFQFDKVTPLRVLGYIFIELGFLQKFKNQVLQVLQSVYAVFDKYYLRSDVLFCEMYLQFLFIIFQKLHVVFTSEFTAIIRCIILQIHQFFVSSHKPIQILSIQCFHTIIPILANQPLLDQTADKNYGMNDGPNTSINDTLALTFAEIRKVFVNSILTDEDQNYVALIQFWRIVNRIYEIDPSLVFFQVKNIEQWFFKYMEREFEEQDIQLQQLKVKREILFFLYQYFSKEIDEDIRLLQGDKRYFLQRVKNIVKKNGDNEKSSFKTINDQINVIFDQFMQI